MIILHNIYMFIHNSYLKTKYYRRTRYLVNIADKIYENKLLCPQIYFSESNTTKNEAFNV